MLRIGSVFIIVIMTYLTAGLIQFSEAAPATESDNTLRYLGRATSIVYSPTLSVQTDTLASEDSDGGKTALIHTLVTGPKRTSNYLLLCNKTLLELTAATMIRVEPFRYIIRIDSGTAILIS